MHTREPRMKVKSYCGAFTYRHRQNVENDRTVRVSFFRFQIAPVIFFLNTHNFKKTPTVGNAVDCLFRRLLSALNTS